MGDHSCCLSKILKVFYTVRTDETKYKKLLKVLHLTLSTLIITFIFIVPKYSYFNLLELYCRVKLLKIPQRYGSDY